MLNDPKKSGGEGSGYAERSGASNKNKKAAH